MLEARTTHGVVAQLNLHEDVALLNLHATALVAGLAVSGQCINFFLVAVRRKTAEQVRSTAADQKTHGC